jgi:hypothetical protein
MAANEGCSLVAGSRYKFYEEFSMSKTDGPWWQVFKDVETNEFEILGSVVNGQKNQQDTN